MKPISKYLSLFLQAYFGIGTAYGIWVAIVLQYRTCGFLVSCPELPSYPSWILNVLLAFFPNAVPYSILIGIGRGLTWLPNLIGSFLGIDGYTFLDWLLVRDVLPMEHFYASLATILP